MLCCEHGVVFHLLQLFVVQVEYLDYAFEDSKQPHFSRWFVGCDEMLTIDSFIWYFLIVNERI
jgi:hypothetical protein